ncbi:50S ribosomal protein L25/general stress protein Ctc [Rhodospirillaceae bacterium SYSU D60014]|uniref:50S ribosomal protein L25/general stress protein Ctc n=1 Tax=Virgifigura deserti TaxID=2268457 RepID=UPI000E66C300
MSEVHNLTAERRDRAGKGAARSTRRAGRTPAVIYGNKQEPVLISVEPRVLEREIHRSGFFTTLFDVQLDGQRHRVLPRDVQFDPVTDIPIHVDFLRVSADTQVHVEVPVLFTNEELSPGLKRGGVLNVVRHEIEMICAADSIPGSVTIDLAGLDIGDSVHISSITLPAGVAPAITDRDFTIVTIAPPNVAVAEAEPAETEEEAATSGAAATPEKG